MPKKQTTTKSKEGGKAQNSTSNDNLGNKQISVKPSTLSTNDKTTQKIHTNNNLTIVDSDQTASPVNETSTDKDVTPINTLTTQTLITKNEVPTQTTENQFTKPASKRKIVPVLVQPFSPATCNNAITLAAISEKENIKPSINTSKQIPQIQTASCKDNIEVGPETDEEFEENLQEIEREGNSPCREGDIELDIDEEDPDPIHFDIQALNDPILYQDTVKLLKDRNTKQKQDRETKLEALFLEITKGVPAPYITPTKFTKRRKKDVPPTPQNLKPIVNVDPFNCEAMKQVLESTGIEPMLRSPSIISSKPFIPLKNAIQGGPLTPLKSAVTTNAHIEKQIISPVLNIEKPPQIEITLPQDSAMNISPHSTTSFETEVSNLSQKPVNSSSLRIPTLGLNKCGIYSNYRSYLLSIIGEHAKLILAYNGDITWLLGGIIRLGMFIYDYSSHFQSYLKKIALPSTISVASKLEKKKLAYQAYEEGKIVESFLNASEGDKLREWISKWLTEVEVTPGGFASWVDKRDNKNSKLLTVFREIFPSLIKIPELELNSICEIPLKKTLAEAIKESSNVPFVSAILNEIQTASQNYKPSVKLSTNNNASKNPSSETASKPFPSNKRKREKESEESLKQLQLALTRIDQLEKDKIFLLQELLTLKQSFQFLEQRISTS